MALTPIDVQQKTFSTELRGYSVDDVDDFLDEVVMALRDYESRLTNAEEQLTVVQGELGARGETEDAISRAFVAAQRSADALLAEARVEAERIIAEAKAEATKLNASQAAEKKAAEDELERLRRDVAEVRKRVRRLADTVEGDLAVMAEAIEAATPRRGEIEDLAAAPGEDNLEGMEEEEDEDEEDEDEEAVDEAEDEEEDAEDEESEDEESEDEEAADEEDSEYSRPASLGPRPWERN